MTSSVTATTAIDRYLAEIVETAREVLGGNLIGDAWVGAPAFDFLEIAGRRLATGVIVTLAATVGGAMPLIAKKIGVDPAVFSTPFISTFCDATGLIIYFTTATLLLGL